MNNTSKKVPMIINLILISLAFVDRIYILFITFSFSSILEKLIYALTIVALIAAFMYVFTEYKKTSSKYFKLFLSTYALMMLAYILHDVSGAMAFDLFFEFVALIMLLCVLIVSKDMGKINSIIVSFVILAIEIAITVIKCVAESETPQSVCILVGLSRLSLSIVLLIMMFLKYSDKQMRGAK